MASWSLKHVLSCQFLEQESEKEEKIGSYLNGSLKKSESNGSYRLAVVV